MFWSVWLEGGERGGEGHAAEALPGAGPRLHQRDQRGHRAPAHLLRGEAHLALAHEVVTQTPVIVVHLQTWRELKLE